MGEGRTGDYHFYKETYLHQDREDRLPEATSAIYPFRVKTPPDRTWGQNGSLYGGPQVPKYHPDPGRRTASFREPLNVS